MQLPGAAAEARLRCAADEMRLHRLLSHIYDRMVEVPPPALVLAPPSASCQLALGRAKLCFFRAPATSRLPSARCAFRAVAAAASVGHTPQGHRGRAASASVVAELTDSYDSNMQC